MQVFQTAGLPPRCGNAIFANIGWIAKSKADATNVVATNSATVERETCEGAALGQTTDVDVVVVTAG
jgi:hypothetical protein